MANNVANIKQLLKKVMKVIAVWSNGKFATKESLSDLAAELGNSAIIKEVPVYVDADDDEMLVIDESAEAAFDDETLVFDT